MMSLSWDDLEYSLGRHLAAMPEDDTFTLYVDEGGRPGFDTDFDGYPRYVQFIAFGAGSLRCEVASNAYLPDDLKHSVDDLIAMREDGWMLPQDEHVAGSPNIFFDVSQPAAGEAATMAMRVFQQVWKVAEARGVVCDADQLRGPNAFAAYEAPADFRRSDTLT